MPAWLRADPERGLLLAAAAVALAVAVSVTDVRFEGEWSTAVQTVYTLLAALFVAALALSPAPREGRPPAWHSVLVAVAFFLLVNGLLNLADLIGADANGFPESGTVVWVGLLLAGFVGFTARRYDSGLSTLLMAGTLLVVAVAFVDWVFSPEDVDTFRWVLLVIALAMGVLAGRVRDERPDHATGFVNAAGLAILAIALSYAVAGLAGLFGGSGDVDGGTGWELVLLIGGAALLAYAALDLRSGPGYLGFGVLLSFAVIAGAADADGASLIGWPILLVLAAAGLLAAGLRPSGR